MAQDNKKKKPNISKKDAEGKSTVVAKDFDWKTAMKWFMKHSGGKKNGNK